MMAAKILNRSRQYKPVIAVAIAVLFLFPHSASAETPPGVQTPPTMKAGQGNYGYFRMESDPPPAAAPSNAETAPQQQPENPPPSYGLKNAVAGENSPVSGAAVPPKTGAMAPWGADAGLKVAETQMMAGQYAQAVQTLKKVMSRESSNADTQAYLGQCYFHLGMMEDARKALDRALMGNPHHMGAHLYIGLLQLKEGKRDLVIERLAALRSLCQGGICEEENYLSDQLNNTKPVAQTAKEEARGRKWLFWKKD
ncbi:MAG: tetratricopeptide repeat protein [Proteobacteria bacterium]|jgi:tetratricopeptide (TPR) repeat protein|nr:tetratricopeptide repeat protein [Pseudomonadota bacterium]